LPFKCDLQRYTVGAREFQSACVEEMLQNSIPAAGRVASVSLCVMRIGQPCVANQ
jgi:hypothetical protein